MLADAGQNTVTDIEINLNRSQFKFPYFSECPHVGRKEWGELSV
jgi:hypothetical protein